MEALKDEIREEMNNVRVDKKKLYDLLLKMVDNCGGGSASVVEGPRVPLVPLVLRVLKAPRVPKVLRVLKGYASAQLLRSPPRRRL